MARTQLETSLYRLARLLNLDPLKKIELADQVSFFETPEISADQTLERAYTTRPELRQILIREERATLEWKAAADARLPKISTSGFWTEQGVTGSNAIPAYQYEFNLEVPLFTGGRISAERAKAGRRGQRGAHLVAAVIAEANALVPRPVPEKSRAKHVEEVAREHEVGVPERDVRVRQIGAEQLVVLLDACAQQQRAMAVQPHSKSREVPRVLVIEPLLARPERADVARVVEHGKRVVMLEDRGPLRRLGGGGEDIELVLDLDDVP